jgi:hypothetical protein
MHIKEALENILENKLNLMKENLQSVLTEKAIEKIEERKIEIAQNYFSQIKESKSPAKEGSEAAKKDDDLRKRHMEKYGKLPKRLTGELAMKFMKKKSKG